jgi:geranylgeranyl diphosphate synthase type I
LTILAASDLARIERHLGQRLDSLLTDLSGDAGVPGLDQLTDTIRQYVTRGGKRVRPQLCLWAFAQTGGGDPTDAVLDLACAWEIFHAFLLVHDDLIDAADTRRAIPSLHRQLQDLDHGSPAFGRNLAIVAGDLLFGTAIRLLSELDCAPQMQVELIRLFSRIACTTGFGQAVDLFQSQVPLAGVCERAVLTEYHWKTAAYTFEGPMVTGAILAGADAAARGVIAGFARAIGQAYQLQNDLLDLSEPAHDGCDLVQGKRTVTLMRARSTMSADDRRGFDDRIEQLRTANGRAVKLAEAIRRDVIGTGAIEQTRCVIERLLCEARTTAATASTVRLRESLGGLIDAARAGYFSSPPAGIVKL